MENATQRRAGDVLIVDDEPHLCDVLATFLQAEGYATRQASNGSQALAMIHDRLPALLLLDYMMPMMDGGTLFTTLHAQRVDFPIAFISAVPQRVAEEYPQVPLLAKPITYDTLIAFVAQYVLRPGK